MKTINGRSGIASAIHGEVTFQPHPFYRRNRFILVTNTVGIHCLGYKACITLHCKKSFFYPDFFVVSEESFAELNEGDYVFLLQDTAKILWDINSNQNSFLLTESCNCACKMCPQPPKKHDEQLFFISEKILDSLRGKTISDIGITGGEPTILGKKFIYFLDRCSKEHPEAHISILTNAKTFSNIDFSLQTMQAASNKTIFCVSLHSDIDTVHDKIVGIQKSHAQTEKGIYNLALAGAKIEIRHVITKMNYKDLERFSEYLYAYFPFAVNYAMMGMEVCGDAKKNIEVIYASPNEYRFELEKAVQFLYRRGLPVSVYNIPLCLCEGSIRIFAKQSISTWKNAYIEKCEKCVMKNKCSGFFTTSSKIPKEYIQPFKEDIYEKCDL